MSHGRGNLARDLHRRDVAAVRRDLGVGLERPQRETFDKAAQLPLEPDERDGPVPGSKP